MKHSRHTNGSIVNPKFPWKLRREWRPLRGSFTTSASEWRALLARANAGDPDAEWGVAERYEDGCKDKAGKTVVRRSARKAVEWFRRAAEHGCAPAQNNLGLLLDEGKVLRRNRREALKWIKRAFRGGDTCAANNVAIMYRESARMGEAVRWFKKGVAAGDDDALIQLGVHYYWGKGARKNPAAAVRYFRKATKAKNISGAGRDDSFFYLGIAYLEGKGVKASRLTATRLFERAISITTIRRPGMLCANCDQCKFFRRTSSTSPSLPTSAKLASPINSPCSTTPGMSRSVRARAGGSEIFPKLQSRMGLPLSVR
jgi:TPR repeat protein